MPRCLFSLYHLQMYTNGVVIIKAHEMILFDDHSICEYLNPARGLLRWSCVSVCVSVNIAQKVFDRSFFLFPSGASLGPRDEVIRF